MQGYAIFTGCTRPPTFLGVPLLVIVLGGLVSLFLAGSCAMFLSPWGSLIIGMSYGIFCLWARAVTNLDDWRLLQIFQRLRIRPKKGNAARWGGISYAPYKLRQR